VLRDGRAGADAMMEGRERVVSRLVDGDVGLAQASEPSTDLVAPCS